MLSVINTNAFITFTVSLIAILNPIGNTAIFMSMMGDRSRSVQNKTAMICAIAVAIILLITTWFGSEVLLFFGISIAAMQTAGGVIIALIGLSMLRGEDHTHNLPQVAAEAKEKEALGVVPLAIPIFAGPGAISTIIAQSHQFPGLTGKLLVSLVCLICAIITLLVLLLSPLMARVLGASGMKVVTRVMGLILAAIAFQMLGEGMIGLLPGLAGIVGH